MVDATVELVLGALDSIEYRTAAQIADMTGATTRGVRRTISGLRSNLDTREQMQRTVTGAVRVTGYRKVKELQRMSEMYPPRQGWDDTRLCACFGGHTYLNREDIVRSVFNEITPQRAKERFTWQH